jgi:hypothetical protein
MNTHMPGFFKPSHLQRSKVLIVKKKTNLLEVKSLPAKKKYFNLVQRKIMFILFSVAP